MSRRRRTDRGFTLLECTVALLLFTLLVVGLAKLTVAHDRLVASTEGWLADDPVVFVDVSDDDLQRLLGVPARLVPDAPAPPPAPPAPDAWLVTVTATARTLDPPTASALVVMTEP
jgi:prepilin-type N-terminal cleavage/methylation domain-containing protein